MSEFFEEAIVRERLKPEDFESVLPWLNAQTVYYPVDFKQFMMNLEEKTEGHYHLTSWISSARVNNICDLLAAHYNACKSDPYKITKEMIKAIASTAERIQTDIGFNCKFTRAELFTMMMLSLIRIHCCVLYYSKLIKEPTTGKNPWYSLNIRKATKYVTDNFGHSKRQTAYIMVVRE